VPAYDTGHRLRWPAVARTTRSSGHMVALSDLIAFLSSSSEMPPLWSSSNSSKIFLMSATSSTCIPKNCASRSRDLRRAFWPASFSFAEASVASAVALAAAAAMLFSWSASTVGMIHERAGAARTATRVPSTRDAHPSAKEALLVP
jgi:hypothetical protein